MVVLVFFAFLAGIVTILSPCILPILPIILSSTTGGKQKPLGVIIGFIASFTFFTLSLSLLVRAFNIPADSLRFIAVIIIAGFGTTLLVPFFQQLFEKFFARMSALVPQQQRREGFFGGVFIGVSLGLLWTPCVGPILASVISLAISGTVTTVAALIMVAYASGTAIPLFLVMVGGRELLGRLPRHALVVIQKFFGLLMIGTAILIYFNLDRSFQTWIIMRFPQYGVGLTKLEDQQVVRDALKEAMPTAKQEMPLGKPNIPGSALPRLNFAPELIVGGEWFNSPPLAIQSLRGKVILIDFWTYTCINCQRTFPYLRSWWDKYNDKGLVIIGVHAPEFEFEKKAENVAQAIEDFNVRYPVMQDNNFATWRAYNNRFWPAKYLIDKDGYVRYRHFGEGAYDETEKAIQELLKETGETVTEEIANEGYAVAARTPETYLGYLRLARFVSPEDIAPDKLATYSAPSVVPLHSVAFTGKWMVRQEYAQPQKGAKLSLRFDAQRVFLVMRSKTQGEIGQVRVSVEEVQNTAADVQDNMVTVSKDRLYTIVNLDEPGTHTLILEFFDNNVELYAFTFG